jgi:hypothetical protein
MMMMMMMMMMIIIIIALCLRNNGDMLIKNNLLLKNANIFVLLEFRGHCSVINWPNFNTLVSQGIGTPEERERDRGMGGRCSGQNTTNIYRLSSPSYLGAVRGDTSQL